MEQLNSVPDALENNVEHKEPLDIKSEPDVNLTHQENVMVRIKIEEQALLEQTNESNMYSDPSFDMGHLQVKEEVSMEHVPNNYENAKTNEESHIANGISDSANKDITNAENTELESNADVKNEMIMSEDSLVSYDYPSFDDSVSMDSNDIAALGNVETCLQEEIHIKPECLDGAEDTHREEYHNIKQETDAVTETHLISNKLINTTSTVTNPQDGMIESHTTKTLVMEILPVPHGEVNISKIGNPEEILPTVYNDMDCEDMFQLNSITGNVLSLEQEAYGLLKAKKSQNHKGVMHPCLKCTKEYKTAALLKRHMSIHSTIEKRAMGFIKGQLTKKANRKKHFQEIEMESEMITLETIKAEQCDLDVKPEIKKEDYECTCGKLFQRRSRMETCLRSHNEYADANPSHQCSTCLKYFSDKNDLATHRKRAHTKKFHCKFCPTDYNTRKELFKHLQAHQKVQLMEYKVISEVVLGKQKLRCFMCGKSYVDLSELKCHVMEDHTSPYSCMHCKNTFAKIIEFGDHMKTYHPDVEGQSVLDVLEAFSLLVKAWKCEECGLQFHEADKLALHQIEKHSPDIKADPQFQCEDCRRVFISQKGLTSHRRVHHSEAVEETEPTIKGTMCLECRKICKDMDALTSHMRLHSPDRKYPCKFCDFRFSTPEKRKSHAELHTGDMKYVCFICEYQCSSENRLKHHKASVKHLNMKQYLASGVAFAQEQSTTEKSQPESEVKGNDIQSSETVPCDVCGDSFPSEREMLDHKQTHPFIEFPNEDKPTRIFFK
ncbi:zinc finger protein 98-like [Ostrinia furnacalis]|uniref:zinc finger protein 98-like n=1 Tax=Ostrinia furnacalis TaxID=93504 RepID=UPI0010406B0B|nr:zinc finger protein 98-like [Ostrinia furnacalis]